MGKSLITGSIVTYHNPIGDIQKVIESFFKYSCDSILFIVDNSLDNSLSELCTDSRIKYIFNNANIGFGAAHNIAIKQAISMNSKYHIILNPDISFSEGVIESLENKLNINSEIGSIMPKIKYPNGETQYLCKLLATPFDLLLRRFIPFQSFVAKRNKKYEFRFSDYNSEMEVPSLSGCFMFVRTSILEQIGGFDERYFMYLEDLDLCRRIGEVSKTVYYPAVEVTHAYEKGSYKNKKLLWFHISSAVKYFNKWGWFWDKKRSNTNRKALLQFK
nr:glycosyltransferase family 2 protein [uncultured Marinifilum sp.]